MTDTFSEVPISLHGEIDMEKLLLYACAVSDGKYSDCYFMVYTSNDTLFFRAYHNVAIQVEEEELDAHIQLGQPLILLHTDESSPLIWFDQSGQAWRSNVSMKLTPFDERYIVQLQLSPWERTESYVGSYISQCNVLNSDEELKMLLLSANPEGYVMVQGKIYANEIFSAASLLLAPQICLLSREGFYAFAEDTGLDQRGEKDYQAIRDFTRPGKTLDEVFTVPRGIYEKFRSAKRPKDWYAIYNKYKEGEK